MSTNHKYRAERQTVDGISFASKREARRWSQLKLLERAGQIACLQRQVKIPLLGRDGPILTTTGRQSHYVADFSYIDLTKDGRKIFEDAKGYETPEFKLKRAILLAQGQEIVTT